MPRLPLLLLASPVLFVAALDLGCAAQPEPALQTQPATQSTPAQAERLRAQERYALAKRAMVADRYKQAVAYYKQALALDPENQRIKAGLAQARLEVEQNEPDDLMQNYIARRSMKQKAVLAEFKALMSQARQQWRQGDHHAALASIQRAESILDTNAQLLPQDDIASLREQTLAHSNRIQIDQ
jgi:tetratricopeptide (TPR) repeat protein